MLRVVLADLTKMEVDAIVNAANRSLLGGGGVDGAIHRAAGNELKEECRKLGGCETGEAKITLGYRLRAKYVVHTVGPIWHGGQYQEAQKLAACYSNSLKLIAEQGLTSVAFPAISTGAYGYPPEYAAKIAVAECKKFLSEHPQIDVYLVAYDQKSYALLSQTVESC